MVLDKTPIFVYGPPKTGTTLFKSLLDGTDSIYVYPNEIKFKWYALWSFRSTKDLVLHYKTKNKDPLKVPDSQKLSCHQESPWDVNRLKGQLQGVDDQSNLFDFEVYYDHLNRAITSEGQKLNGANLIYHDVVSASRATQNIHQNKLKYISFKDVGGDFPRVIALFFRYFPQGKLILINRNPYAQFLSRLKFWKKSDYPQTGILAQLLSLLRLNHFYLTLRDVASKKNVLVVSYERLILNTSAVMKETARFLEVEYTDAFERPTAFGEGVRVSTATEGKNEVYADSLTKWQRELSESQKKMVSSCTPGALHHGYKHEYSANRIISGLLTLSLTRKLLEFLLPRALLVKRLIHPRR